jgi:hypothetical protein
MRAGVRREVRGSLAATFALLPIGGQRLQDAVGSPAVAPARVGPVAAGEDASQIVPVDTAPAADLTCLAAAAVAEERHESFDKDPGWEGGE